METQAPPKKYYIMGTHFNEFSKSGTANVVAANYIGSHEVACQVFVALAQSGKWTNLVIYEHRTT